MALAPLPSMPSMFQNITQMPAMNSWRMSMPGVERENILWRHIKQSWALSLVLLLTSCVTYTSCLTSLSLGFLISIMRIMPNLVGDVGGIKENVCSRPSRVPGRVYKLSKEWWLLLVLKSWRSVDV